MQPQPGEGSSQLERPAAKPSIYCGRLQEDALLGSSQGIGPAVK